MEVKTNPFYELRDRLYASAAAGCSLIAEDFRLKRAVEAFQPMSETNKVFGKLYAMCNALLTSEHKAKDIVGCIALADALAVTQGTFADNSETASSEPVRFVKPAHLPLKLIDSYKETIRKAQYNEQELSSDFLEHISDPRVISSFLSVAGKNGVGIADMLTALDSVYGEEFVPMLFESLDLSDKNATGNQVRFISSVYRDKFNDQYIKLAENEDAPQGIRIAAIEAMASAPENEERLAYIYKVSKGKIKNAALLALGIIGSPAAEAPIKKMAEKPKSTYLDILSSASGEAATEYARNEHEYILEHGSSRNDPAHPFWIGSDKLLANKKNVIDVFEKIAAKHSKGLKCPNTGIGNGASINDPLLSNLYRHDDAEYRDMIRKLYSKYPLVFFRSAFILELMEAPENAFTKMCPNHDIFDDAILEAVSNIFTTPDGWYRIREIRYAYEENYYNKKIFKSIPDDMLNFLSDIKAIHNADDMQKLYPNGSERETIADNMTARGRIFLTLLKICPDGDRERIKAAAEKYAWAMNRNYPCASAVKLLSMISTKSLDGVLYNYVMFVMKNKISYAMTYELEDLNLPEDVIINDAKRLIKELTAHPYNDSKRQIAALKQMLKKRDIEYTEGE